MEAVTVAECEGVFAYLDARINFFRQPAVYKSCYLALLRSCNTLLRRLSKVRQPASQPERAGGSAGHGTGRGAGRCIWAPGRELGHGAWGWAGCGAVHMGARAGVGAWGWAGCGAVHMGASMGVKCSEVGSGG